jgi:hypothetical protein
MTIYSIFRVTKKAFAFAFAWSTPGRLNFQAHLPCEALEVATLDYANSNFARGSSSQLPRTICPSLFLSRFYAFHPSFV